MEISQSDIVISLAGRDKGNVFFVMNTDGVYVFLADGKSRKIAKPKRKKRFHVRKVLRQDSILAAKIRSGEQVLNSELRRELAHISQEINLSTKEGS